MSNFSHNGFSLHPELRDKRKPVSTDWMRGPRITAENLKKGTGTVELMDRPEWIKAPNGMGAAKSAVVGGMAKPVQNPAVFTFGKFKGRLFVDVLEENPKYLQWCVQEIEGFEAKLRKAGINPDEI
jgi:hypothetical protein